MPINVNGYEIDLVSARQHSYDGIVRDGLVLHLDSATFNTVTGTTWYDLSGNGNNGTLTNGPTYNSGNGGSIVFDGSNDYTSLPFSTTYTVNNDHTILMWVKSSALLNSNNDNRVTPYKEATSTNSWNPGLWYHGTTIRAHTNGRYVDLAWSQDTAWHQMGQVYDYSTNTLKVILDGASYTGVPTSYTPGSASGTLFIGNPITTGTVFFNGKIAIFQTYNRALSSTEIAINYNALKGRYGL